MHAGPLFAGTVDAKFWEDLVPRLAQTYNFVWDTVVCLSALVEHVPYTSLTATFDTTGLFKPTNQEHQQALRIYNRAIVNVRQLAERGQIDDSVVALSYILFASVEFQQRNVKTGNDLVQRCCKILTARLTSPCTRRNSTVGQAIHQVVTPFVLRRSVVIATLGNALPLQWVTDSEVNNILKAILSRCPTLNQARVQFHNLVHHCFELIRLADFLPNIKDDDPGKVLFLSERQALLDKLMQWKASFAATSSRTPDVERDWIISYLLMYWAVCYTSLAACVSSRQTVFDDYMDHFAEIIEHAKGYLRHGAQSTNVRLLSSFDPGVIPPLYFCATKCRDPILRREALRLMRQAPRQENLWAFVAPELVVEKVISVEEGECQLSCSKDSAWKYAYRPPEERRVAYVSVVGRDAPGGKQRQALELSRFEFVSDCSRRLITDYIWLDNGGEVWSDAKCGSLGIVT
jgi:hypothetical protein